MKETTSEDICRHFIQGMSRISHFWGYPKAMGAVFGAIYLSPEPVSLNALVEQASISKGAVSVNVRSLERLGMVHKRLRIGDRKDYYTAETDFWKIIRGLLRERQNSEFDQALHTVSESIDMLDKTGSEPDKQALEAFYHDRLQNMKKFFDNLDGLVAMIVALDELRVASLKKLFGKLTDRKPKGGKHE